MTQAPYQKHVPSWLAALESNVCFALVEPASKRAGALWANWRERLAQEGFDDVDIRSLGFSHAPLASHSHSYDLRVLVLAGGVSLTVDDRTLLHAVGDHFEIAANTPHSESFCPDGYIYLAARRHVTTPSQSRPTR